MVETVYQPGSEILQMGEKCNFMMFIVNGVVELQVLNEEGQLHTLELLGQGDMIGQYSVLFNNDIMFSVIAKTNVRILMLDRNFFIKFGVYGKNGDLDDIEGLEDSITSAQQHIDKYGVPICDYKIWANSF